MTLSASAIELRGVTKTFGDFRAVDALDLTIPRGALYGFIGPNGAGKTTTIRMIMSILFPDRGDVRVLGHDSALDAKDRIGYLPEERGLYRKMKVAPYLTYIARLKGVASRRRSSESASRASRASAAKSCRRACRRRFK
jgi:ABC-2 type transport system ATP-binding protein